MHELKPFDIAGCSYFLSTFYKYYPAGTINVVVVVPGVGSTRKPLLIKLKDYYFVGPDNRVFTSIVKNSKQAEIYHLTNPEFFWKRLAQLFTDEIYLRRSAHVSLNKSISSFGEKIENINLIQEVSPRRSGSKIIGRVIYEDRFGNLITNIKSEQVLNVSKIIVGKFEIENISSSYSEAAKGGVLAIIGSSGNLEISVNMASAADIVGGSTEVVCCLK
ncbi:MAG: hypothetical protein GWM89_05070 [Candidatus Dadabacteria bacterium]|nr:SAM-dependent chlorinase/fluorinase [Candidatus Dadabacteria bacterium]NIV41583.1 hypothetical protein [Candidatus Dadabacteria bacterium]NIX15145.1 hypothetical protein [Candidatus Dadabacteria bacterium]NIY21790.1 hypothetical protein [Candidatus Dadabacteria bacterium]